MSVPWLGRAAVRAELLIKPCICKLDLNSHRRRGFCFIWTRMHCNCRLLVRWPTSGVYSGIMRPYIYIDRWCLMFISQPIHV